MAQQNLTVLAPNTSQDVNGRRRDKKMVYYVRIRIYCKLLVVSPLVVILP